MLAFLVSGCAISGGNVVGTALEPAHNEHYQSGSVCYSYDADMRCTFSMPTYSDRWIEDRCYLTVADSEGDGHHESWVIPCEDRSHYRVGQWADRP